MLKKNAWAFALVHRLFTAGIVVLTGQASLYWYFGVQMTQLPGNYTRTVCVGAILAVVFLSVFHVHETIRAKNFGNILQNLGLAWLVTILLLLGIGFFSHSSGDISRRWFVSWGISCLLGLLIYHLLVASALRYIRCLGFNYRSVVIVGAGEYGSHIAKRVQKARWMGYRVLRFFDDKPVLRDSSFGSEPVSPLAELESYVKNRDIDEIWLALPLSELGSLRQILHELRFLTITIRWFPDLFELDLLNHSVSSVAGITALDLRATPMHGLNRFIKGLEDRCLAAFILLLISPILLIITLLIKCTSKGPVLFKQQRYGWDNKLINVYKFRTMHVHQEQGQITQAKKHDPRITSIGRILRRSSLDELPQFINVLQGRMSIVGPRPHAVEHNEYYKNLISRYMQRHMVKPGITGWAQINGLRGETDTVYKMQKRIEYDLYYIEHWSLWFDLKIIAMTLLKGFINSNAY